MATVPQGIVGKPRFGPSDCLIAMLRACSRDSTEAIETRLKCMLQMFLQHYRDDEGNEKTKELAAKCCYEAGVWYHRILESLISQERKRLGFSDISGILEHDLFQRCLVACCLEIAVTSNSLPCDFPLLLQILKLEPYHFWKVIEPVWRVGSGLPHYVVTHLIQVEEKVLENLAWISDSPLWDEITPNEGHMPTCQQVMHPNRLEGPMQTDPGVPRDVSLGMNHSARTEQQCSPSAINKQERCSSLHLFARKVYSLMAKRLRELCSTLEISDELRLKIWTCFEYSLVHCSCLMEDRHLDQLLMCAIYIIAKITKMEIPFKQIMKCYKSQPRANKSVSFFYFGFYFLLSLVYSCELTKYSDTDTGKHSSTILTPNTPSTHYPRPGQEERGNLIHFYNQVYTTKMQHFAKQFRDTPPLSPYPRQWKASPRCYQLSNSPSISISPYNTETPSPHRTGLCYYFNSSPPEVCGYSVFVFT
uniref:Retinoblastoma-associated protein A-box domain-containing protein n=1 Tax=Astatotilapia calliptera TaxID=8154 RepID=A0AAX7SN62_ASTCA